MLWMLKCKPHLIMLTLLSNHINYRPFSSICTVQGKSINLAEATRWFSALTFDDNKKMSEQKPKEANSVYDFTINDIDGHPTSLEKFRGHPLVIVNVACQCGYTKSNYEELADMLKQHHDKGLRVLLFPCNQFGNQEPGPPQQIKEFVNAYSDKFDIFEKVKVNGSDATPLYKYLKDKCGGFLIDAIKWNFTKFLVNKQGIPVARFAPKDNPQSFGDKVKELL